MGINGRSSSEDRVLNCGSRDSGCAMLDLGQRAALSSHDTVAEWAQLKNNLFWEMIISFSFYKGYVN